MALIDLDYILSPGKRLEMVMFSSEKSIWFSQWLSNMIQTHCSDTKLGHLDEVQYFVPTNETQQSEN